MNSKRLGGLALGLAALLIVTAFVACLMSIWGGDHRWMATAFTCLVTAVPIGAAGAMARWPA